MPEERMADVLPLAANPAAPDVYADEVAGWHLFNGNVRLTFASLKADHSQPNPPVMRMVAGRVVLPVGAAVAFAVELYNFLQDQGVAVPGLMRAPSQPIQ